MDKQREDRVIESVLEGALLSDEAAVDLGRLVGATREPNPIGSSANCGRDVAARGPQLASAANC